MAGPPHRHEDRDERDCASGEPETHPCARVPVFRDDADSVGPLARDEPRRRFDHSQQPLLRPVSRLFVRGFLDEDFSALGDSSHSNGLLAECLRDPEIVQLNANHEHLLMTREGRWAVRGDPATPLDQRGLNPTWMKPKCLSGYSASTRRCSYSSRRGRRTYSHVALTRVTIANVVRVVGEEADLSTWIPARCSDISKSQLVFPRVETGRNIPD